MLNKNEKWIQIQWFLGAFYLFTVNITRMFTLIINTHPIQALWLSQIIGCIEGFVFLTQAKYKTLNSLYLALAPFPFIGFFIFIPLGADVLFYLNHFPHIFLFYLLFHKEKINLTGVAFSGFFMLIIMNLTWAIEYAYDLLDQAVNATTSPFFGGLIAMIITWYIFLWRYLLPPKPEKMKPDFQPQN